MMRLYILLFLAAPLAVNAQSDSISRYINIYPLFQYVDSIARDIEKNGDSVDLVFFESSFRFQEGMILWRKKGKYAGTRFTQENKKVATAKIDSRKIKKVLSTRLFSDSCNLCELLRGEKKADIDHHFNLYLKRRTNSQCNEMYFISSAMLFYDQTNCIWDIREIISL